ncbi:MAG: DUF6745 domain-containing protein [Candidatus Thorarchaeota archaeon]|jgi:hypothetical protein
MSDAGQESPKVITSLTEEQEKLLPVYRDKWAKEGFCTDPADRPASEQAALALYEALGFDKPSCLHWVGSPLVGSLTATSTANLISDGRSVKEAITEGYNAAKKHDIIGQRWWHYWVGCSMWPAYRAWYDYMTNVTEVKLPEVGVHHKILGESCAYIWPNKDFIILCDRPLEIHVNDQNELHNEKGVAVRWPDGWGVYSINGVLIPELAIENPEKITVEMIDKESNAEVSRILREIYGTGRYVAEKNFQVIDVDTIPSDVLVPQSVPIMRALLYCPSSDTTEESAYLCGSDGSTPRVYFMRVPPHVKSCKEAHETLAGLPEDNCLIQG